MFASAGLVEARPETSNLWIESGVTAISAKRSRLFGEISPGDTRAKSFPKYPANMASWRLLLYWVVDLSTSWSLHMIIGRQDVV